MIFSILKIAIIFANSIDADRFDTLRVYLKEFFDDIYEKKKKSAIAKSMQITSHAKRLGKIIVISVNFL